MSTSASATKAPSAAKTAAATKTAVKPSERLTSLDAYRGFIMLAMASGGLALAKVAKNFPESRTWQILGEQFDHAPWKWGGFWDMIQPSFMFMVGVSMAYSYAGRQARGQSYGRMLGHAVYRSVVLVLLGVFLTSNWNEQTNWIFPNVLCQIGLGYTFLFLLWNRPPAVQLLAAVLILVADWGLFYAYPTPPADFTAEEYAQLGVPANWPHLEGRAAHWDKNTNVAAAADRVFLNWFPREDEFVCDKGGYTTLNFIPSLATMIFGLMAGGLMRSGLGPGGKLAWLVGAGLIALGVGYLLDIYDICPVVKRIWTPSWAIYSTGWTLLMLAAFYLVVDVAGFRRAAWPLVVVGMNSIAMYCMAQLLGGWIARTLQRHLGEGVLTLYGGVDSTYEPVVRLSLVLFVMWLVCVWLYRQRIFFKI